MLQRRATRITRELTAAEQNRLAKYREQIADELRDLQTRDQMRATRTRRAPLAASCGERSTEASFHWRRLPHAGSRPVMLDNFLTGERTLRSDVIDRLTTRPGVRVQSRNG